MYQNLIYTEFQETLKILNKFVSQKKNLQFIEDAAKLISSSFKKGNKVIACGNGGSHCDAMHFSEELMGRYRHDREGYPAIVISDPSYFSCVSNDFGYEKIFSRYIESIGKKNDVLFGISTSGNSENILYAIRSAVNKGMKIIILTGKDGGKLSGLSDVEIRVPHFEYADRIQEVHIKIIHILILIIEKYMNNNITTL